MNGLFQNHQITTKAFLSQKDQAGQTKTEATELTNVVTNGISANKCKT